MIERPRRLRSSSILRNMVAETKVSPESFILPIFLCDGVGVKSPINSLEGHYHYSVDKVCADIEKFMALGLQKFLLFGIPEEKDSCGTEGFSPNGVVNRGLRQLKSHFGQDIYLIADVCMCEYTDHGHCGILTGEDVDNDKTLPYLQKIALSNVESGADMVAPSDMMDGRIGAIRQILDENHHTSVPIMSYSAKYASSFYGPFREAAKSAPSFGDRKTYQMDPRNRREALREARLDTAEGADILMVKPALSYLDVILALRQESSLPIAAYSVSGEYAMLKSAGKAGLIDERRMMIETATSIFRAGADVLISYYSPELVEAVKQGAFSS